MFSGYLFNILWTLNDNCEATSIKETLDSLNYDLNLLFNSDHFILNFEYTSQLKVYLTNYVLKSMSAIDGCFNTLKKRFLIPLFHS